MTDVTGRGPPVHYVGGGEVSPGTVLQCRNLFGNTNGKVIFRHWGGVVRDRGIGRIIQKYQEVMNYIII